MPDNWYIYNALIVNEGKVFEGSILIKNGMIENIFHKPFVEDINKDIYKTYNAEQSFLLPGIIDTHVHFREPGLTLKADFETESKAAVAGGVTSVMDMPNTIPQTTSETAIKDKLAAVKNRSYCNFAFHLGATNDNYAQVNNIDIQLAAGIKMFLGSSTGNMLIDDNLVIDKIMREAKIPVLVHCEDENIIKENLSKASAQFSDNIPVSQHGNIRSRASVQASVKLIIDFSRKNETPLHLLHVSTMEEIEMLEKIKTLPKNKVTAEVCIHHLLFSESDYAKFGTLLKINPPLRSKNDQEKLWQGIKEDIIDTIATDHAPHTWEEKQNPYLKCPSGAPSIQHALLNVLEYFHHKKISIEQIVEKMCHAPARIFNVKQRGFLRNNYFADLTIVNTNKITTVTKENLLYKCKWTVWENTCFQSSIEATFVNGYLSYNQNKILHNPNGIAITFNR